MRICTSCKEEKEIDLFYHTNKRGTVTPMSWCKVCLNTNSAIRQKINKARAVQLMGGKCMHCGYSKCVRALEFHHPDRDNKDSGFEYLKTWGWKRMWEELKKCILLCSNCHREEECRISKSL